MSSEFSFGGNSFWVANRIAKYLLLFATERGAKIASKNAEAQYVEQLSRWLNTKYFSGICVEFDVLFPTPDEHAFGRKFIPRRHWRISQRNLDWNEHKKFPIGYGVRSRRTKQS